MSSEYLAGLALGDYPLLDLGQGWDAIGSDILNIVARPMGCIQSVYMFTSVTKRNYLVFISGDVCE